MTGLIRSREFRSSVTCVTLARPGCPAPPLTAGSCSRHVAGAVSPTGRRSDFGTVWSCLVKATVSSRTDIEPRLIQLLAVCRQDPARRCPALGTGPGVPAIPPDVVARVSAVRHHLAGIQPDPAHPAGNDTGRSYAPALPWRPPGSVGHDPHLRSASRALQAARRTSPARRWLDGR
jgi:hypothetical protein